MRLVATSLFVTFVLLTIPHLSNAALTIPDQSSSVNPAICDQLFDLPQGTITRPADQVVMSSAACAAYQFLLTRYTPSAGGCSTKYVPGNQGVTRLDPSFAIQLANMLKTAPMNITIVSGYRNPQAQQCANSRAINSNHIKGCAVDLSWEQSSCNSPACQWVLANGPKSSLNIPMHYNPEWNHLQPVNLGQCKLGPGGIGAPFDQALRGLFGQNQRNTTECLTSLNPPIIAPAGTVLQSQCLTNAQGQRPQLPPMSPAATQPTLSGAVAPPVGVVNTTALPPGTCAPQFYCSGSTYYYRSSACVDQMYQTCQYGCKDSTTCAANPQSASSTNSSTSGSGTSTYDLIGQYANPVSTTNIGTVAPIALNPSTGNPAVLQPPSQGGVYAPAGVAGVQPPPSQETFTSSDLANSPLYGRSQSAFLAGLNSLKNTLLGILNYLRPFGGNVPSQTYVE